MLKRLSSVVATAVLLALPVVVSAISDPGMPTSFTVINVYGLVDKILGLLWPLFFGAAIIVLLIAGFLFLTAQGEADKIKTARDAVIWAIVGIALGVLAFTIPYVVKNVFNP